MVTPANPLRARRRRTPLWLGAAAALVAVLGATWALVPGEGSLRVDIDRAVGAQRAEVFVDGAKRCDTTPCVVELPPGKKVVKVVADGFTPVSVESAEVSARAETRLTVRLEPEVLHQGVFARADQAGVRVAIDGDDAGPLPLKHTSLPAGEHRLRFFGDGYRSLEKVVTVQRGELLDLGVVRLAIDEPKLTLELATPGATVVVRQTVDGRVTGRRVVGPWPRELELKPGRYEVVATRAGYQTAVLPVRFDEGDARQALVVRLSPLGATRLPVASAPPTAPAAVSRAADVFAGRQ